MAKRSIQWGTGHETAYQFLGYFRPRGSRELNAVSVVHDETGYSLFGYIYVAETLAELEAIILSVL